MQIMGGIRAIRGHCAFLGVCVLLALAHISSAQSPVSFGHLSVNEGLSQNSAVSVTQDRDGFLWIATQEGLNRYDGKEFKLYKKKFVDITQEHQLRLGQVLARENDELWIIPITQTPERLHSQTDSFESFREVPPASCFYEDQQGILWLGTLDGRLYTFNDALDTFELHQDKPGGAILSISAGGEDQLLITRERSVATLHKKTGQQTEYAFPEKSIHFSCALKAESLDIWVGTLDRGLFVIPQGQNEARRWIPADEELSKRLSQLMILDIASNEKGEIWLATYGDGSFRIQPKTKRVDAFSHNKRNPRSLHYNDVLCLFEDAAGVMWLGTDGSGLSFYDQYLDKFRFFHNQQVPENINIDVVRSILVDSKDHLWIGTSGKGLTEYNPRDQSWQTHNPSSKLGLASSRIMSLFEDSQQRLWIGYQDGGLGLLDLGQRTLRHFDNKSSPRLPAHTIWRIMEDSKGRVWLATRNSGLIQFDPRVGLVQQFLHQPGQPGSIPSNNIRTLVEGRSGTLWVGTEHDGIARFYPEDGQFYSYRSEDGFISSNHIKSLYWSDDILWVGTNGAGLNRIDLNHMSRTFLTKKDGLANDVIYGILADSTGHLWLSSNKGISRLAISSEDSLHFSITNFSNYAGTSSEFNTGAYYKAPNGSLYFGSLEGVYWFHGDEVQLNPRPPSTAIVDFRVFDQTLNTEEKLSLSHDQNTLTIELASLAFSAPHKNQYKYRLHPLDEEWIAAGNNSRARYTNLRPGQYTFSALSSNYDGIWSKEPVTFSFSITPPWYQTAWAYVLYVFLALAIGYWLYRFLKWRWFMRVKLRLKEREAQRLKEVNTFKSKVFTGISHEFRTPLTLISGPIDRLLSISSKPAIKVQLHRIKRNTGRLLDLVDQLLEVSKIKSGNQVLSVQKGNLGLILQMTVAQHFHLAREKEIQIDAEIPVMTELWFDHDKVSQIASNLLHNAIKYGKEGSTVHLRSWLSGGHCQLEIENETVFSYDATEAGQLLEPYYQKDEQSKGFGIGMSLVRDYVELCRGNLEVDLSQSSVFMVRVELPVLRYDFHPDEIKEELELPEEAREVSLSPDKEKPQVLLVEDNEEVRRYLAQELQTHFHIIEAKDGREGLFQARQIVPDLIVSDIVMPELDGLALCRTLKSEEATSHIPILLLSGKSSEEDQLQGIAAGADDYFLKPVASRPLILRMQKLIELRAQLRARYDQRTAISPRDLSLNSADENFLEKVQQIIDEQLVRDEFTANHFSELLGMSRMQLHRKLKAITGLSTSAFIRDQRLQLAVKRLQQEKITVAEVAYAVGFSSPSYFTKCFKETYDMTPREYQQEMVAAS